MAEVIKWNEAWLLSRAGVVGVGVGLDAKGDPRVEVLTDGMTPEVRRAVEERLDGVPLIFTNPGQSMSRDFE